jgi:hypothetical protein
MATKNSEQSWIALFNRGFEAWTSYRRLDFCIEGANGKETLKEVPKDIPILVQKKPSMELTYKQLQH